MKDVLFDVLATRSQIGKKYLRNVVKLFEEGATVPFIARYRKEMTGSLNEVSIISIKNEWNTLKELDKRKDFILKSIEEQNGLDDRLKKKIFDTWDITLLEDLYLPFKKKIKTKATKAIENGLESLAKIIMAQNSSDLKQQAKRFLNKNVKTTDDAFEGARFIIAQWINENSRYRNWVRQAVGKYGIIKSKVVKSKKEEARKYEMYFDFEERLNKIPSHRLLAIFRGEKESFLRVKIEIDHEYQINKILTYILKQGSYESEKQISLAVKDSYKRLLFSSIENEGKKMAKLKADQEAISVFKSNLKELLLSPPLGSKTILALDPGFKTGCKLVVLDDNANLIYDNTIFPHPPINKAHEAAEAIHSCIKQFEVDAIAVGNGTAGKETIHWLKKINLPHAINVHFVNESGASIYSASEIARKEFPNKDITVRGAVSIGRRLMDPLAELVKIEAKSIGVGQYQHDVNQNLLKESLNDTVTTCVNAVGINLNTATEALLTHVSGLGPTLSNNLVQYRKEYGSFKKRKDLLKVPRMGSKAYEQSAGFLRIKNGDNLLDNTGVHPESYFIVEKMATDLNVKIEDLIKQKDLIQNISPENYCTEKFGLPTIKDILKELEKPGLDPRGEATAFEFSDKVNSINDIHVGMVLPGIVNNITKFGAFVDIGIKESGLVHISEISNTFISDVTEVLSLNMKVTVKVLSIDSVKKRVGLSIKQA